VTGCLESKWSRIGASQSDGKNARNGFNGTSGRKAEPQRCMQTCDSSCRRLTQVRGDCGQGTLQREVKKRTGGQGELLEIEGCLRTGLRLRSGSSGGVQWPGTEVNGLAADALHAWAARHNEAGGQWWVARGGPRLPSTLVGPFLGGHLGRGDAGRAGRRVLSLTHRQERSSC
jgi:hypothetical protein